MTSLSKMYEGVKAVEIETIPSRTNPISSLVGLNGKNQKYRALQLDWVGWDWLEGQKSSETQRLSIGWIGVLGFTISIRQDGVLEGGNSTVLDRDSLATVQPNLQLTDMINCSPTDRSVRAERTFHGAVEAKTNRLFF